MTTLAESRGWRLAAFGLLNLSQGLPWGFITAGYFYLLTDLKLPPEQVGGAIALARLPWAFKMVWGLVYDRFPGSRWGRRRPFIIASQALLGLAIGSLMFIPDPAKQLWLVSGVLFFFLLKPKLSQISDARSWFARNHRSNSAAVLKLFIRSGLGTIVAMRHGNGRLQVVSTQTDPPSFRSHRYHWLNRRGAPGGRNPREHRDEERRRRRDGVHERLHAAHRIP